MSSNHMIDVAPKRHDADAKDMIQIRYQNNVAANDLDIGLTLHSQQQQHDVVTINMVQNYLNIQSALAACCCLCHRKKMKQ